MADPTTNKARQAATRKRTIANLTEAVRRGLGRQ
jgi:hypothetical protein